MGILHGVRFGFDETMTGYATLGVDDPVVGEHRGRQADTKLEFRVEARIDDMERFLEDARHMGTLAGQVEFAPLGGTFPIRDGVIHLFDLDPETGVLRMVYAFGFTGGDGRRYFLKGQKDLAAGDGSGLKHDITHLYTRIHQGDDETGPVVAAGVVCFLLKDSVSLVRSMRVFGEATVRQRIAAYAAFASLASGSLRDEYLAGWRPLYDASYENLVLSGTLAADGDERPFHLVAGEHQKGFPWGDDQPFSDILLLLGDGGTGWRRFCLSAPAIEGLDVRLSGQRATFAGRLYEVVDGFGTSVTAMAAGGEGMVPWDVRFDLALDVSPLPTVSFPFPFLPPMLRHLNADLAQALREVLPETHPLGIQITPHAVRVQSGDLSLARPGEQRAWRVDPARTAGEGERGTFRSVREPTLRYHYLAAGRAPEPGARVQIRTGVLRDEREQWAKDRLDRYLGALIDFAASAEYDVHESSCKVRPLERPDADGAVPFAVEGHPLLEVANDHLSTGVFFRRLRHVRDADGVLRVALEEDMDLLRREPIGTDREATVAVATGDVAIGALDVALDRSGFDAAVDRALAASGKTRDAFAIVIKPNFMFSYSRLDSSTYTDPILVARLVERLKGRGFTNIKVVEAQSTYGQFFLNRGVVQVAQHLGYDRVGCPIVDMTEESAGRIVDFPPPLGPHPVSPTWAGADFRVSFAKNKTHCYAYYTLTLKNIYGTLCLPNKFKEYHCERGIYEPTIQYLKAYPVHFGIVDAWASADGPFGVFACPAPKETRRVIAGEDLVAVDWVGASMMGLDPRISPYMRLAVDAFGKPRIRLDGEARPYRPWVNVPPALALFAHEGLDARFDFGNAFYMACANMDPVAFPDRPGNGWKRCARKLTVPLRRTFFVRAGENPTLANRIASRLLYWAGF